MILDKESTTTKKFHLMSLKMLYTVVIHARVQFTIIIILPLGGRLS